MNSEGEDMLLIATGRCLKKGNDIRIPKALVKKDGAGQNRGYSIYHLQRPFR